jgi:hypothetical protein
MNKQSKDLIKSKIKKIYQNHDVDKILSILNQYGNEEHEKEQERVHLAILKLCDEENLEDPSKYVEAAKQDYRDVLAWAEYPNQLNCKSTSTLKIDELEKLQKLDRDQYLDWLNRV